MPFICPSIMHEGLGFSTTFHSLPFWFQRVCASLWTTCIFLVTDDEQCSICFWLCLSAFKQCLFYSFLVLYFSHLAMSSLYIIFSGYKPLLTLIGSPLPLSVTPLFIPCWCSLCCHCFLTLDSPGETAFRPFILSHCYCLVSATYLKKMFGPHCK